jgi:hypothetical protein
MGDMIGSEIEKAEFWSDDTGDGFPVQYNPTNFKYSRSATWKEHEEQGTEATLEFQKLSAATMSCDLLFDTTIDQSDVRDTWVNRLIQFTNPEVSPKDGEAKDLDKCRPHVVNFYWGGFFMTGVIESINVDYVMFSANGNPIRAKVQLKMKEWLGEDRYAYGAASSGYGTAPVKLVTMGAGQTVSSVAAQFNTTPQQIGEDNNLDDLLDVPTGLEMIIWG